MVDWTKKNLVPTKDLLAWHQYVPGVSTGSSALDYSGNGRNLALDGALAPVITPDLANGESGWSWDGTKNSLLWSGSSILAKRIFVVAGFDDSIFDTYRGILSGDSSGDWLTSDNTGTKMFTFGPLYDYRKDGLAYADYDWQAPIDSQISLLDASHSTGVSMNGIRVGQQKTNTSTKHKGVWLHSLIYGEQPSELAEFRIYQYHAMRFQIWQRTADGLYIFPFAANKTNALDRDRENYLSEPYAGEPKALVRGNFRSRYQFSFLLREQEEFDATISFWEQHYPLRPFIFRDYRHYPYREVPLRFTSSIREQGTETTYRFNYSFEAIEVDLADYSIGGFPGDGSGNFQDGGDL